MYSAHLDHGLVDPTDSFKTLREPGTPDENYPGSKQKRVDFRAAAKERREKAQEAVSWDAKPIKKSIRGVDLDLFTIGPLAKALGKKPVTIRRWIDMGWLPKARYRTPPVKNTRGDAGRRLWTREQVELIVRIATEEGIVGTWHPDIPATNFTKRVFMAWKGTWL